ncbi:MAG: PPOX class F420-dependent oxidoreductase [Candidatus Dormibacteraceae bacterium]
MSVFTTAEIDYLRSQRLCRLATAGADGHPHVVPTSFRHNADLDTIDVGGHSFATRKKWRDAIANPWVALVVDDLESVDPWRPRMLEVRGRVEALETGGTDLGPGFDDAMFRVHPTRVQSFGLNGEGTPRSRRV